MRKKILLFTLCFGFLISVHTPSASAAGVTPLEQAVAARRAARLGNAPTQEQTPTPNITVEQTTAPRRVYTRPSARSLREAAQARLEQRLEQHDQPSTTTIQAQQRSLLRKEVVELTNAERAKEGVDALTYNRKLELSAQAYAQDLYDNNYFSHTGLNGSTVKTRINDAGYGIITIENCNCRAYRVLFGENLAKGQRSAAEAVRDWMNSEKHREAILLPDFTEIGIGIAGNVWVQHFGSIELR